MKITHKYFFTLYMSFMFCALSTLHAQQKSIVLPAHSHNDYEHEHPLFDALECNFKSIEADVYSVGDSLFVAHDSEDIKPGRTLRQLYLEPLKKRIVQNNGSVYGNGEEVILFIDIKDDGLKTYQLLHKILEEYKQYLTAFENGVKKPGKITVVVSGNRPFEFMKSQKMRYAGYDGRIEDLDSDTSSGLMPIVSDNWAKCFKWDGKSKMPENEKQKLTELVKIAESKGYILRFWNTPNQTPEQRIAVWTELKNAGVGLIGADNLKELQKFLMN
ncbi:MAG TPA: phosphatidylinositol-specific phospholipase C/glycerophosphodiester phosphodiesterase family protein [Draconibacterium sp.]|nr:phosphatidylinositol-specific phospholipase C/glycerophosphodiester phosphodiesterase family protein [Draconibacterium sp.]